MRRRGSGRRKPVDVFIVDRKGHLDLVKNEQQSSQALLLVGLLYHLGKAYVAFTEIAHQILCMVDTIGIENVMK